ncbi:hypothetical protein MRB53_037502 [Persea americana]|nr:hypothetical protein MRB53_037502 [Persea americana]
MLISYEATISSLGSSGNTNLLAPRVISRITLVQRLAELRPLHERMPLLRAQPLALLLRALTAPTTLSSTSSARSAIPTRGPCPPLCRGLTSRPIGIGILWRRARMVRGIEERETARVAFVKRVGRSPSCPPRPLSILTLPARRGPAVCPLPSSERPARLRDGASRGRRGR